MFGTLGGEGWHIFLQDECMMLVETSKKENNQKECGKDPTTKTCLEGPKISLPLWIIALLSDFQLAPLLLSGLNIEGRSLQMNITDAFFNVNR